MPLRQAAASADRLAALAFIEIDWFKRVNDVYGHDAGNRVLREVAQRIAGQVDVVARYGGEEFVVLLPDCGGAATRVAERIRESVERHPFDAKRHSIRVTVCVGLSSYPDFAWEELLRRADEALYRAKREGRNRVVAARRGGGEEITPP